MPLTRALDEKAKNITDPEAYTALKKMIGTPADLYRIQELFVREILKVQDLEKRVKKLEKARESNAHE